MAAARDFAVEAFEQVGVVAGKLGNLEHHIAFELVVASEVDRAHRSLAQLLENGVTAKLPDKPAAAPPAATTVAATLAVASGAWATVTSVAMSLGCGTLAIAHHTP